MSVYTGHDSKFGKSRLLPLHPAATAGLNAYLDLRGQFAPHPRRGDQFMG